MLGFLFGFNARIGRLNYFLAGIALAILITFMLFSIANYAQTTESVAWVLIAAAVLMVFATFSLQAMRIRDIGWDPVCVLPAWIAAIIIDGIIAHEVPAFALGQDHDGTIVGALGNLVMLGILTFWPSSDRVDLALTPDLMRAVEKSSGRPAAADRIARAQSGQFGRR